MHILEKLYDCADTHLQDAIYNWDAFCAEFCDVFQAQMVLYRIVFDPASGAPTDFETIISSVPLAAKEYQERELYKYSPVPEAELEPLEPILRTSVFSDEQLENNDIFRDFSQRYGYYYQLIAPAILSDTSFLGLVVWRDKTEENFTSIEKQRITLFMRHLLAKVDHRKFGSMEGNAKVDRFGKQNGLTKTETQVLAAVLDGQSLRSIAADSQRSYGTIRWHVQNILSKCQAPNQKSLIREFYGLIER